MEAVGIRTFKAHLSQYVRRVHEDGSQFAITDRGAVVAWLVAPTPVEPTPTPTLRERILARGGTPARDAMLRPMPPLVGADRDLDMQALLHELRGDR